MCRLRTIVTLNNHFSVITSSVSTGERDGQEDVGQCMISKLISIYVHYDLDL